NAFGAALWGIDYMFTNAENGSSGVNFHGGSTGMDGSRPFFYAPIQESSAGVTGAAPLFYAMVVVALSGAGDVLATTASASNLNVSAHTVVDDDGATSVVLVNKDATSGIKASVDLG